MSYRLEPGEPIEGAVQRIVREQVDRALRALDDPEEDLHEKVHETRKRCKKIRGALRLCRPAFENSYRAENAWYRDAARTLSDLRDAHAFLGTFDALMERFDGEVDRRRFAAFRQTLVERRDALAEAQELRARLAAARERLAAGRPRIDGWRLDTTGFDALGPGVGRSYRRARVAMRAAYEEPAAARFHEWRKRTKYHRYHCRLLRNLWKPVLDPRRDEVKRLSDRLGEAHDLAELRAALSEEEARFGARRNLDDLLALLERRQAELRAWSEPLGRALFAEKPKRLVGRLETCWDAWQHAQALGASLPRTSAKLFS